MKKHISLIIYYFFTIFYLEICHKALVYGSIFDLGLFYTGLFSLFLSVILTFFSKLGNPSNNKKIALGIVLFLSILYIGSYIYYDIFSVPFSFQVTSMAGQALDFIGVLLKTIAKNFFGILALSLPLILYIWKMNKIVITKIFAFEKKSLIILAIAMYIILNIIMIPGKNKDFSAFRLYWKQNNLNSSIRTFGLLTAERIDLQRSIFGFDEELELIGKGNEEENGKEYNKMDIDFDKLIAEESNSAMKSLYSYFQNEVPTEKNEYTGLYKGKNLIFILAESFNSIAVSEELTPTLYKLTHSGFQFNNFYTPVFLSTTGGEFQAMTGLVPTADALNEWYKGEVSLPFAIGNTFGDLGYETNAFHDYHAEFYDRIKTMPTLGFYNYFACTTGIEKYMECNWNNYNAPNDDEMIKITFPRYKNQESFVTYYITMSGHFPYELAPGKRNYDIVKDLPYSDDVKGYLATQIDLDHAVERLIKNLEKEGLLDDTVICLVGDHYPYALSLEEVNEVSSYQRDEQFEVHHSNLIIWNNEKEKIEIDKIGSQIDVLPTLLNLFGIEYDSRLMIGHDILSSKEGLAIFSNMSWISDSGSYSSTEKKFTAKKEVDENYVTDRNRWVNNSSIVSKRIILNDVYRKIFEK